MKSMDCRPRMGLSHRARAFVKLREMLVRRLTRPASRLCALPFFLSKCPYCDFNSHCPPCGDREDRFAPPSPARSRRRRERTPGRTVVVDFFSAAERPR